MDGMLDMLSGLGDSLWSGLKATLDFIWDGIKGLGGATWNALGPEITNDLTAIGVWIKDSFMSVFTPVKEGVVGLYTTITDTFNMVIDTVTNTFNSIAKFITGIPSMIGNAVKDAVKGTALGSMASSIGDWLSNDAEEEKHVLKPKTTINTLPKKVVTKEDDNVLKFPVKSNVKKVSRYGKYKSKAEFDIQMHPVRLFHSVGKFLFQLKRNHYSGWHRR